MNRKILIVDSIYIKLLNEDEKQSISDQNAFKKQLSNIMFETGTELDIERVMNSFYGNKITYGLHFTKRKARR